MSDKPRTIVRKGENGIRKEGVLDTALVITPGMLAMRKSNGKIAKHGTAGGRAAFMIATEDELQGKTVATEYAAASRVLLYVPLPGSEVECKLDASAAAIVKGDRLESAGDGTFRKAVRASLAVAGQSGATGDLTFTSKVPGAAGNAIRIVVADAGSASVAVSGSTITITPGSGANTADAVKTQVEANATANALISVVSGGAGEPGTQAGAQLAGGVAEGHELAEALEDVDNSGAGATTHILAEVL